VVRRRPAGPRWGQLWAGWQGRQPAYDSFVLAVSSGDLHVMYNGGMSRAAGHAVPSPKNADTDSCDCVSARSPVADRPRQAWSAGQRPGMAHGSGGGTRPELGAEQVRQLLAGLPTADRELYSRWVAAWDRGELRGFWHGLQHSRFTPDPAAHMICLEWAGLAQRQVGCEHELVLAMGALGVRAALRTGPGYTGEHLSPLGTMTAVLPGQTPSAAIKALVRSWELVWGRPATLEEVAYLVRWSSGPRPHSPEEIAKSAALAAEHNPDKPAEYTAGVLTVRRRRRGVEIVWAQSVPIRPVPAPPRPETWPSVYSLGSMATVEH